MQKKNIVIITKPQLGYQTDYFKYAYYLKDFYNITFICGDQGFKRKDILNVEVKYIQISKLKVFNFLLFIIRVIKLLYKNKYDVILLKYIPLVSLLRLSLWNSTFLLDIRTGSVFSNKINRYFRNLLLKAEASFFSNVTIISDGLGKYLKIKTKNLFIVPGGAEIKVLKTKKNNDNKNSFYMLYVGTFLNRNIEETILGYSLFLENLHNNYDTKYTIIGFGPAKCENRIKETIIENKLEKYVHFIGKIDSDELAPYFESHNVGVSYVPIKSYFNYQPPTKTFEYLFSGLICVATRTYGNTKVINDKNGILCEDNPQSFSNALLALSNNIEKFNSSEFILGLEHFSWENIVVKKLKPIIEVLLYSKSNK